MSRSAFSQATIQLPQVSLSEDEAAFNALERLERIILDHVPRSVHEAVAMLDVIIPGLTEGGRSDGLDIEALANIRSMLASLPTI